jgi:NADH-quinone oxidoreductase subunit C
MDAGRINIIKNSLGNYNVTFEDINGTLCIVIDKKDVLDITGLIKTQLGFDLQVDAVSIDRYKKENRFEMIYNLYSTKNRDRIFIRIKLDSKNPEMESLTQVWSSANWYEREAYDLMGINFLHHPDLRRMYMPEEYEYYPLRKDFPLTGIEGSIKLPNK